MIQVGDDVIGLVLSVDRENSRVQLSFRSSLLAESKRRLVPMGKQFLVWHHTFMISSHPIYES